MWKKKIRRDLAGKQVYPNWRIDKNVSWFNISQFLFGLIYSFLTFEYIWDFKMFKKRFNITKIWLPTIYAKNYTEYVWIHK